MLSLFAAAFLLGLVYNAMPGAVFAETVRQGVRGGFRPALAVQLGSLTGDALWAVLGLAGVGLLLQLEWLRLPVGIAGVGYLLFLAWDSWRAASQEFPVWASITYKLCGLAFLLLAVTQGDHTCPSFVLKCWKEDL